MTNHPSRASRTYLALTVAATALTFGSTALAQTPAPTRDAEVVVVTGSRIATAANRAISPVRVITADTIRDTGEVNIDEILKTQNQFLP